MTQRIKIIGGSLKGKKLPFSIPDKRLRPTSAKVREALFDILRERIMGAAFLDLYAGSGAVGFEALSRGAAKVYFVDNSHTAISAIKAIPLFSGNKSNRAIVSTAAESLKRFAKNGETFDVVYVDPPYHSDEIELVLPLLGIDSVLKEDAVVVVEHFLKTAMPETSGALTLKRPYRYGDTVLSLYTFK
ncbi:MAG: 16S rRNA (guanine(966)-N(2))-methyltransferase RsmD [Nitrospirae bacterium]|nr:16S rRNA (guanine(966)-N(2))-methyltransferase RsmD [Nitrospirota bacterium]